VTKVRENFSNHIQRSAIACWDFYCERDLALGHGAPVEHVENPMTRIQNFLGDESGVTAIEYALIASLIAVFIIVAVQYVGTQVSTVFTEVGNSLK
jgi:pilus assembly protein Flp/PilA